MRTGKLTSAELKSAVFSKIRAKRQEVIKGAGIAEDSAIFCSDGIMLITSDPVTADAPNIGAAAVNISANDIIASGGEPILMMLTILAPITADAGDIEVIMEDAAIAAEKLNIEIAGGHTEFTDAVNRFVLSATVIGKDLNKKDVKPIATGDAVIMTKTAAIEGTSILASIYKEKLKGILAETELNTALDLKNSVSVFYDGKTALKGEVKVMHDITEGGIYGAVSELSESIGKGIAVYKELIPVLDVTRKISNFLGADLYRLISSGSLIVITANPEKLLDIYKEAGIDATLIGYVTDDNGAYCYYDNKKTKLEVTADELFRITGDKL